MLRRTSLVLVLGSLALGCTNTSDPAKSDGTAATPAAPAAPTTQVAEAKLAEAKPAAPATAPAAPVEYTEVSANGRLYVVGSKAAADKATAGKAPEMSVTKIGYGPTGETVVFEANKQAVEKQLMSEYEKRHPRQ